ncbi:Ras GTPase [Pelomyxa schiedti]|nr:Ras GTPase [Pelomyxa schiedti]
MGHVVCRLLREGRAPELDTDPECVFAMGSLLFHSIEHEDITSHVVFRDPTSTESLMQYFGFCQTPTAGEAIVNLLSVGRVFSVSNYPHKPLKFNRMSSKVLFSVFDKHPFSVGRKPKPATSNPTCQVCSTGSHCGHCNHCTSGSDHSPCKLAILEDVIFSHVGKNFAVGMENACGHFRGSMDISGKDDTLSKEGAHGLAPHLQHLSALTISNVLLSTSTIEELARHIAVSHTLKKLGLYKCDIGSNGAKLLASALSINESLVELILDNNPIGDVGISHITQGIDTRASIVQTPLNTLSVRNCSFGERGGLSLSKGLLNGRGAKTLNILNNTIGEHALQELAKTLHVPPLQLGTEDSVHIIFMGAAGIGKSSLIIRFLQNHFTDNYEPNGEDTWVKIHTVDSIPVALAIRDTGGQSPYCELRDPYIRAGDVMAICFSITSRISISEIESLHRRIQRVKEADDYPKLLIGCKCDLDALREVSREEGLALAKSMKCSVIELSAKSGANVTEAFDSLARLGLQLAYNKLCGAVPISTYPSPHKPSVFSSSITQAVSAHSTKHNSKKKKPLEIKHLTPLNLPCRHSAPPHPTTTDLQVCNVPFS